MPPCPATGCDGPLHDADRMGVRLFPAQIEAGIGRAAARLVAMGAVHIEIGAGQRLCRTGGMGAPVGQAIAVRNVAR